ncbi:uncharacterized protein LOC117407784 isoform X3 [Acipenser ruthenus]|uniref:uncharacterized protein LOC117407784 isoform X3 n=1 Tax=Acipenser ruthenus TaxID=7906 RepID=UPI0027417692|nr:uncharacterized protein LOC117407784 isoform X3 [Acipenser ruthenus]
MALCGTCVDFTDIPKRFLDDTDTDTDSQDDAEDDIEMCISDSTTESYGRRKGTTEERDVTAQKARCLISLLVEKGCDACGKFIFKLAERDPNLYSTLRLHHDSRILFRMIPKYIKSAAVLEGLLKDMQEMKQLSDGEVEKVKKQASTQRMTSHLTSMVMKKGDPIRENFLSKLAERDTEFYRKCSHDLDPVWRLREVQSQFANRVSDAVIEGLLKDMLKMKVLSDEDVEEVRDAPQNTRLQSWLVEQINSGRYPGLSWTNEALKQFRIPWKHHHRKDSTPEDRMIFKDWAVATGRYWEGIDKPDPAAWRRNFRCALAKDKILVLRADHSQDAVDPHKIYQIDSNADSRLEERGRLPSLLNEHFSNRLSFKITEFITFRPTIHHEGYRKYYRFSFKKEGEYQCEITALIFDVASPAEVVYGTEHWEKCPLDQSSLLPAGPLYNINSPHGALGHLSFPHSECSSEDQNHLMVAHYKNENVEMIKPSEVTETHIKIKVTEMSLFGLVRRLLNYKTQSKAQVLLFLRQLTEIKKLNVFLLSSNVVLDDVQEKQKGSIFIETSSHCVVLEEEKYSVSCDQENAHVQPDTYDFVRDYGPNFPPTFEIFLNNDVKGLTLEVFKSTRRDASVWSRRVWLDAQVPVFPAGTARCTSDYVQSETAVVKPRPTPLQAGERLKAVRTRLIEGLNASVIRDLLDDMLHMNVLNDGEVESVKEGQTCTKDKASCLIDMKTTGAMMWRSAACVLQSLGFCG